MRLRTLDAQILFFWTFMSIEWEQVTVKKLFYDLTCTIMREHI